MHEQKIIDNILEKLDTKECTIKNISLIVNEKNLTNRLMIDINNKKRSIDIIDKSIKRISLYNKLNTYKIDTNDKTIDNICKEIINCEKRDLYNNNKVLTGNTIYKNELIPKNCNILMVIIFIQNSKGQFLIQKRSKTKGGEWAFTGGHPKSGESSLNGIYTETKEELGININKPILFKEAKGKNTFCDLYYIRQNIKISNIVLQDEEVDDVKFVSIEEIHNMYKKGIFKKGHYLMFLDCLNFLNN